MKKRLTLSVVLLIAVLLNSSNALASPSPTDLVISEVMYNTCNTSGTDETPWEWIEIKNKGASNIAITSSWQLCDSGGCIYFPGSVTIGPGEYWLLVEASATAQNEINLTGTYDGSRTIDMGTSWRTLNNTSDTIYILDDSSGLMDCVSWGSPSVTCSDQGGGTDGAPANAGQGQSISKINTDWQLSAQGGSACPAYGTNCGGSPYGPNTWASGPNAVTLHSLNTRRMEAVYPIGLLLALGVAISLAICMLPRRIRKR